MVYGRRQPPRLVNLHSFGLVVSLVNILLKWSPYATGLRPPAPPWLQTWNIYLQYTKDISTKIENIKIQVFNGINVWLIKQTNLPRSAVQTRKQSLNVKLTKLILC